MDDLIPWLQHQVVLQEPFPLILLENQTFSGLKNSILPIGEKGPTYSQSECHSNPKAQFIGLIRFHDIPFCLAIIVYRIEKSAKNHHPALLRNCLIHLFHWNSSSAFCTVSRDRLIIPFLLHRSIVLIRITRHPSPSAYKCLHFWRWWKSEVNFFVHN